MTVDAFEACVNRYEPAHQILIRIALSSNKGSGESAHTRPSLRCSRTKRRYVDEDSDQKLDPLYHRILHHRYLKEA